MKGILDDFRRLFLSSWFEPISNPIKQKPLKQSMLLAFSDSCGKDNFIDMPPLNGLTFFNGKC